MYQRSRWIFYSRVFYLVFPCRRKIKSYFFYQPISIIDNIIQRNIANQLFKYLHRLSQGNWIINISFHYIISEILKNIKNNLSILFIYSSESILSLVYESDSFDQKVSLYSSDHIHAIPYPHWYCISIFYSFPIPDKPNISLIIMLWSIELSNIYLICLIMLSTWIDLYQSTVN